MELSLNSVARDRSPDDVEVRDNQPVAQTLALSDLHGDGSPVAGESLLSDTLRPEVNPLLSVKARLTVCVGTTTLTVGELMAAKEQQVLRLDSKVAQPVDLLLEGKVVARGQLVAVDEHFGVRITELPVALKV